MKDLHKRTPTEFEGVFDRIGKDWMLITAAGKNEKGQDSVNTMTASWGGMGVLWNRPVAFCFVRPQRYTCRFIEQSERFSLSFFDEQYRAALRICGTKSGKDIDKWKETGFTPVMRDGVPTINEARYTLICRKLYVDTLKEENFLLPELLENYKAGDFHRVYVVEIEEILEREQ